MAPAPSIQRANDLISKAQNCLVKGDISEAAKLTKEAISIAPDHEGAKRIFISLQSGRSGSTLPSLCQRFRNSGSQQEGKEALQHLKQRGAISDADAEQCVSILLDGHSTTDALLDELTAALLTSSLTARRQLATEFIAGPMEVYEKLWSRGIRSSGALLTTLLDETVWKTSGERRDAVQGLFQLALGKMLEVGEDRERAIAAIARVLAADAQDVKDLIDIDVFEIVLSALDIRLTTTLRSQATLATIKLLEVTKEEGEQQLTIFITSEVAKQQNDHLIVAFSAAAAIFPIVAKVAANLFLTEGFLQGLVPNLERNSQSSDDRKSHKLEHAALELLSAACIDKACREAIYKYCVSWVRDVAETSSDGESAGLAALVLAKISGVEPTGTDGPGDEFADLSNLLTNMVLNAGNSVERQASLEGLAFTSLKSKVKEDVVNNQKLLKSLVETLNDQSSSSPAVYGVLTVLVNVTMYRPAESEEQKRMSQLKAYADSSKPRKDDPNEDETHVRARCRKVLDAGTVPQLVSRSKAGSKAVLTLIVQIIHSLSTEQKHRSLLAQQGAVKLLLQTLERLQTAGNSGEADAAIIKHTASHALARILISVNPNHVFSAGVPAASALRPLLDLLTRKTDAEQGDLLPTFESLLALTNLASTDDNGLRDTIIRAAWPQVEELLLSSVPLVQRAAVELVCNLMASPAGVAKFADGGKQAGNRMHILLALADVDDLATRKAAGGALAMLTEWDAAVQAVLNKERGVRILLSMCEDDSDEMRHRGFACLLNVVSAPGDVGVKGLERVKAEDGPEVLKAALQRSKNPQVLQVGIEVLKKLV